MTTTNGKPEVVEDSEPKTSRKKHLKWQYKAIIIAIIAFAAGVAAGIFADRQWLYDSWKIGQIIKQTIG